MTNCWDCYYMYFVDETHEEGMDCSHGNAVPENGAPELICDEINNCPFYEEKDGDDVE